MDSENITTTPADYSNMTYNISTNATGQQSYSLRPWSERIYEIVALCVGCVAIVVNICSLLSLSQLRKRLSSHYRMIVSLAMSDMMVGVSMILYIIHKCVHVSYSPGRGPEDERLRSRCFFMFVRGLLNTSLLISLLNLMFMGLDHYIAIAKPLHYTKIMSKTRTNILIVILWSVATILGFSAFFSGITKGELLDKLNYCEVIYISSYREEFSVLVVAFVTFIVLAVIYVQIYRRVRQARIPTAHSQAGQESRRNNRALLTTALILGTFILCWLPQCILEVSMMIYVWTHPQLTRSNIPTWMVNGWRTKNHLLNLLLLNSILDPIIYTVRMPDIKLGYRRLFRSCSSNKSNPEVIKYQVTLRGSTRSSTKKLCLNLNDCQDRRRHSLTKRFESEPLEMTPCKYLGEPGNGQLQVILERVSAEEAGQQSQVILERASAEEAGQQSQCI